MFKCKNRNITSSRQTTCDSFTLHGNLFLFSALLMLQIPIKVVKETAIDPSTGQQVLRCGFRVGGGIDQDFRQSPGFTDNGIYITEVHPNGPAYRAGLRVGDKILQCNGYDFTIVTHKKAVEYIKKGQVVNLLIARRGVT